MITRTADDIPNGGGYEVCRYVWGIPTGTVEIEYEGNRRTYPIDLMRQNESFAAATVLLCNIVLFYNKHIRNTVDVASSRGDSGNSQVAGSAPRGLSQWSEFCQMSRWCVTCGNILIRLFRSLSKNFQRL
jgi:hypothetical protein